MINEEVLWNDSYNVGVDYIDKAHRKLFSILRHILNIASSDSSKKAFTCRETLNFLKSYTVNHFMEEEGYMRSINYPGYDIHKRLHDNLRDVALPTIESELEQNNYSDESIHKLVAILSGWLNGHIIVEDRAISGHTASRYTRVLPQDASNQLNTEIFSLLNDVYHLNVSLLNNHYEGNFLADSRGFEFIFQDGDKTKSIIYICQQSLILKLISIFLGTPVTAFTKEGSECYCQFLISLGRATIMLFNEGHEVNFKGIKLFDCNMFHNRFDNNFPIYSSHWTSAYGDFATIIQL